MTGPVDLGAVRELLAEKERTFVALDELLPPAGPPPAGEPLRTADGSALGVIAHFESPPGTLSSLWSAREAWQLHPLVPAAHPGALESLLLAWQARPAPSEKEDSARSVVWPSRDVDAAGVFRRHGLEAVSVLAVRAASQRWEEPAVEAQTGLRVRKAETPDLAVLADLALAELDYSARLGGARHRPDARELRSAALRYRLSTDEPVWLAERDGSAVGMAECSLTDVGNGRERQTLLRPGRWGYVNCLSVLPEARGRGVGGALIEAAHQSFTVGQADGSYLYYNPVNPRSSVFWPRHGYRPLWTIWEVSPASALR
jgi:GNAT superfamily N-acetyltransferase